MNTLDPKSITWGRGGGRGRHRLCGDGPKSAECASRSLPDHPNAGLHPTAHINLANKNITGLLP
eukprot:365317-Chlamydomonas_euryale.AAC.2